MDLEETINQLGGRGFGGALVYIGTRHIYNFGGKNISLIVNGRKFHSTAITITLRPDDTYDVRLESVKGAKSDYFKERQQVYCDELQSVVEELYDEHMQETNKGFIPLG